MIGKMEKRCEPEFGDPGFRVRAFILLPFHFLFFPLIFLIFPVSLFPLPQLLLFSFLAQARRVWASSICWCLSSRIWNSGIWNEYSVFYVRC